MAKKEKYYALANRKIINVVQQLQRTGSTPASTVERIAAAIMLNEPKYLPDMYADMVAVRDRLDDDCQGNVRFIKRDYMRLIVKAE